MTDLGRGPVTDLSRGPVTDLGTDTLLRFLGYAQSGDRRAAASLAVQLLNEGLTIEDLIGGVLVPAQQEIGERWYRNLATVADEHLSTAVVQAALEAASAASAMGPPSRATAAVACAEGDWHSLAPRFLAEILEASGIRVSFLGASTPADHLSGFLADRRPTALVVTCSVPLYYEGVVRLTQTAHTLSIPVLVGGRGVTPYGLATRLGADADPDAPAGVVAQLEQWAQTPPTALVDAHLSECIADADIDEAAVAAFDVLARGLPLMAAYDEPQRDRTREDLAYILRFARAAVLVGRNQVFSDFMDWQRSLLSARSVPPSALDAGVAALRQVVTHPQVAEVLVRASTVVDPG